MPVWALLILAASVLIAVALVFWRIWPVVAGRARDGDGPGARLDKWNAHLVPLLRKTLSGKLLVAHGNRFLSKTDGAEHTMATWSLEPSILPDVDFVALARPGTGDAPIPEVLGVIAAPALRELLPGSISDQLMFGHRAWVHVWPDTVDLDRIVRRLTPVQVFRDQHGVEQGPTA